MNSTIVVPAIYGPVRSWRFGRSLGIDLLGATSTCSLRCRYCQLGTIKHLVCDRAEFVPISQVREELAQHRNDEVDVVTFSGSGEPTLACNLKLAIAAVREHFHQPVVVLTNGTLLGDPIVQRDLNAVDVVAVKLDGATAQQWRTINQPISHLDFDTVLKGMIAFREQYAGHFAVQTMIMESWPSIEEDRYKDIIRALHPDEVQLNTPLRPRPLTHEIDARGNHLSPAKVPGRLPKHVTPEVLSALGDRLQADLPMPIKHRFQSA